jgi:polysaccharide deacetylase family protein (PEP-CTERM system associated)
MLNALTIDVEDYYQVSAFEKHIDRSQWDRFESRVVANTHRLLKILDRHSVQATFFVLGWVADKFPQLVRDIDAAGHEIGSHTFWHRLIYEQSPEEFRSDLKQSRDVLEAIIGRPVTAFRAPSFSITSQSLWALDVLAEEGFLVDSSIFPVRRGRYGIPHAPQHIYRLQTKHGPICEFPPSVVQFAGKSLPVCGGGYFRLYPGFATQLGLTRFNREHAMPFVFYLHPWEIDPQQPRLHTGSAVNRFRHYVNLGRTERKLNSLLERFRFGTISQAIAASSFRASEPALASGELSAA